MAKSPPRRGAPRIPNPDRPGQAFQNLVASIERSIAGQVGVTIETNVLVKDIDGDLREHDIILTHTEGLRVTKTAIECKDHNRKIGKPELEAFRSKCSDTGIHKGVLVSSKGFTQSVLKASRRTNVQCLELAKAVSFPWMVDPVNVLSMRNYSRIETHVFAIGAAKWPFLVFGGNGNELNNDAYERMVELTIDENPELNALGRDGPVTVQIDSRPEDGAYLLDADGVRFEIDHIKFVAHFTVTDTFRPFEHHSYSGDGGTLQVITSDFSGGGANAKLVMVRDDEKITVTIEPELPSRSPEDV